MQTPHTLPRFSSLMVGTAQFGLPYGIANTSGQPPYEVARDILAYAVENGVNTLDTAPGYGQSEEVLGKAIAELGLRDRLIVVSKIKHMADDFPAENAAGFLEQSVLQSLQRLGLESLPVCLFHVEENFRHIEELIKLRDRGLVQHVGVSAMTPPRALSALDSGLCEAMQLPASMLDQRFLRAGVFDTAQARQTAIFVRSVYLQGLILMEEADIPEEVHAAVPVLRALRSIAAQAGLSLAELASRFILSLPGVTSVIAGVESVTQIKENIALVQRGPLPEEIVRAITEAVPEFPEIIVNPRLWSRRMPDAVPAKA